VDDRIGPYVIERPLGEGSAATVYLGRREWDGVAVAIKVLRPELASDPSFRRRFIHEARTAAEVKHRNLVPILDEGESNGHVFLALAYGSAGSLGAMIEREGRLSVPQTIAMALDIAAGLQALHDAGVIHRDIKPSNVVLMDDGRAALTDFGLAKGPRYTALTTTGRLLGTMAYLAPERISGHEATIASDIYAFGCLIYECLAGAPPFADATMYQLAFAQLHSNPVSLQQLRQDVSAQLDETVLAALAKSPDARPSTAQAFAQRLSDAAEPLTTVTEQ
jgi:serine/threonine protein kinase